MNFNKYLSIKSILKFSSLNYFQAAISFLVAIGLARKLGPQLYGYYTYGIIFNSSFFVLVQFGMDKTLVRDLVQKKRPAYYLLAGTLIKASLVILGLVFLLTWGFVFKGDSSEKVWIGLLFATSGGLFGLSPRAWFDYQGKIQHHAQLLLIERLIFLIGVGCLIFGTDQEMIIFRVGLVLLFARSLLFTIEWLSIYRSIQHVQFPYLKSFFRPLLVENSWVWFAAINNLLMTNANQFILDQKIGPTALGLYGFALQLIMLVQLMQSQLSRLASPSIARTILFQHKRQIFRKYWRDMRLCLGLTISLLIPIYFLAPIIVTTIGGRDYQNALPILRIFCIWSIVYGVAIINNQYLLSFRLQKSFFWISAVFGLCAIALGFFLIDLRGAQGAALALLISHTGSVLIQLLLVIKKIRQHVQIPKPAKNKILSSETKIETT